MRHRRAEKLGRCGGHAAVCTSRPPFGSMTVPGDEQMFIRFLGDLERVVFTNVVMISMPALLIRLVQIIYSGLCMI